MSNTANVLRQEMPDPAPQPKPPRENLAGEDDRLLHLITREAFAMNGDQRALALSLMRAVRGWNTAA